MAVRETYNSRVIRKRAVRKKGKLNLQENNKFLVDASSGVFKEGSGRFLVDEMEGCWLE